MQTILIKKTPKLHNIYHVKHPKMKISAKVVKQFLPIFTKSLSKKSGQVTGTCCKTVVRKFSIYKS